MSVPRRLSGIRADISINVPAELKRLFLVEGVCFVFADDAWQMPPDADAEYYVREAWDSIDFPLDGIAFAFNGCGDYMYVPVNGNIRKEESALLRWDHELRATEAVARDLATWTRSIRLRPLTEWQALLQEI